MSKVFDLLTAKGLKPTVTLNPALDNLGTESAFGFGAGGKGHLRFSYAEDRQKHIIPGIKRFLEVVVELAEKSNVALPLPKEDIFENLEKIAKDTFKS